MTLAPALDLAPQQRVRGRQLAKRAATVPVRAAIAAVAVLVFAFVVWPALRTSGGAPNESTLPAADPSGGDSPAAEMAREVTASVVDRPNVPDDVADKYWFAQDLETPQAGQLGTTARVLLQRDELPIAAANGVVATVVNGALYQRERVSTLRVWDVRSGRLVVETTTALWVEHGALVNGTLFWTGIDVDQSRSAESELYPGGGVWALAVEEKADPKLIIAAESVLRPTTRPPLGEGTRAPFALSATSQTSGFTRLPRRWSN